MGSPWVLPFTQATPQIYSSLAILSCQVNPRPTTFKAAIWFGEHCLSLVEKLLSAKLAEELLGIVALVLHGTSTGQFWPGGGGPSHKRWVSFRGVSQYICRTILWRPPAAASPTGSPGSGGDRDRRRAPGSSCSHRASPWRSSPWTRGCGCDACSLVGASLRGCAPPQRLTMRPSRKASRPQSRGRRRSPIEQEPSILLLFSTFLFRIEMRGVYNHYALT